MNSRQDDVTLEDCRDLLGVASDVAIAAVVGCCPHTVAKHRRALGIKSIGPGRRPSARPPMPPRARVRRPAWRPTPAQVRTLGTITDIEAAARFGVSKHAVQYARAGYAIPAFCKGAPARLDGAEWAHMLGTMADDRLAAMAGVSGTTVYRWRTARNIKPHRRWSRAPAVDPLAWSALSVWALDHDLAFLTTTAADALGMTLPLAGRECARAVRRGELVCLVEPSRGVCGQWVTP